MQYRKFGNTDLLVSEIGFGAWAIGGNAVVGNMPIGWGKTDDAESVKAIHAALDSGINFFDTADFYGLGHSEALLGTELRNRPDMVIATKVGHRSIDNSIQVDYSKAYIKAACELSLQRLKRDHIDYYQLHTARVNHLLERGCVEAMEELVQQGKVRYWGLSLNTFYPAPEAELMIQHKWGSGFQLVFNIINQRALQVLEMAGQNNYGVIARMPLQFGLLTGKFSTDTHFAADDHRSFRFTPGILNRSIAGLEERVWSLCKKYSISKTALALSYILSYEAVHTVIPGIRTSQHVADNTTGLVKLLPEDKALLRQAFEEYFAGVTDDMEKQG